MSKRKRKNSNTGLIVLVIGFTCAMCCIVIVFINLISLDTASSVPAVSSPQVIPLETVIFQTASAAQAQTAAAASPTPFPTQSSTAIPSSTIVVEATPTIFIFELQTGVAQPTNYVFMTNTPFIFATSPNMPSGEGNCNPNYPDVCVNDNPRLTCDQLREKGISNFRVTPSDPLGYDRDNDGIGCDE